MDIADLSRLILLLVCVALSAFFSASETAFIALPRARLMHLINVGTPGANRVGQLLQRPDKFLATVLLSNNLVNTAVAALGTTLAVSLMGSNDYKAVLAAIFGVTLILLVFGEALPKTIAWHRSERVAFAVARPLTMVGLALAPPVHILQIFTSMVNRRLGITDKFNQAGEEEIRALIAAGVQSGMLEAEEFALLDGVRNLQVQGSTLRCDVAGSMDPLIKAAARHTVINLKTHEPNLEDIFLAYYGEGTEDHVE